MLTTQKKHLVINEEIITNSIICIQEYTSNVISNQKGIFIKHLEVVSRNGSSKTSGGFVSVISNNNSNNNSNSYNSNNSNNNNTIQSNHLNLTKWKELYSSEHQENYYYNMTDIITTWDKPSSYINLEGQYITSKRSDPEFVKNSNTNKHSNNNSNININNNSNDDDDEITDVTNQEKEKRTGLTNIY
jgi:hypothetical protein